MICSYLGDEDFDARKDNLFDVESLPSGIRLKSLSVSRQNNKLPKIANLT